SCRGFTGDAHGNCSGTSPIRPGAAPRAGCTSATCVDIGGARVNSFSEEEVRAQIDAAVAAATASIPGEFGPAYEDPAQQGELIRQNNLAYAGLIAIALVLVQPLVSASSLDVSAQICVIAFAVSIPLLAALIVVGRQEEFRRRATTSLIANW